MYFPGNATDWTVRNQYGRLSVVAFGLAGKFPVPIGIASPPERDR